MLIKGTEKIKGVLDLSSIKQQLTKNYVLPIRDSDFHNSDIQIALKMGFLVKIEESKTTVTQDRIFKCKNIHTKPINITGIKSEIKPGQIFELTEKEYMHPSIKSALEKRLIDDVETNIVKEKVKEGKINTGVFSKPKPEISDSQQKMIQATKKTLDTNEELDDPKVIEEQKSTVWNPVNNPVPQIPKFNSSRVIDDDNPPPVQQEPDKRKVKSIIWNPTNQPILQSPIQSNQDIVFADQKEEQERIKKHPILGKTQTDEKLLVTGTEDVLNDSKLIIDGNKENKPEISETEPIISESTTPVKKSRRTRKNLAVK